MSDSYFSFANGDDEVYSAVCDTFPRVSSVLFAPKLSEQAIGHGDFEDTYRSYRKTTVNPVH